jgi:predicted Zn-dependent peptidase
VDGYFARLDAVTLADARRAIQKYYPQDNLVFVIIGKAAEIGPVVKKYATSMQTVSITEPGFSSTKDTK